MAGTEQCNLRSREEWAEPTRLNLAEAIAAGAAEGREESSGEGQSDRNSVSGLNTEVRPPRPLPRPTLPKGRWSNKVSAIGLARTAQM